MSNLQMEIREDYDHDNIPAVEEQLLADLNADDRDIDSLQLGIEQLSNCYTAIESFGISPTTVALLHITELMTSTAMDKIALESHAAEAGDSVNSVIALEAITGEIKEKAAQWSAKLLSMASKAKDMVAKVVTPIWDKIKSMASAAKEKIGTNPAVVFVKTHPYEILFYSIMAATTIYATTSFALKAYPALGAPDSTLVKFSESIVNRLRMIKLPWGKIYTKVQMDGKTIMCEVIPAAKQTVTKAASAGKLGWTRAAIDTLISAGSKALGECGKMAKEVNAYYMSGIFGVGSIVKYFTRSPALGTAAVAWTSLAYGKVLGILAALGVRVLAITFKMIKNALSSLISAKPEPA